MRATSEGADPAAGVFDTLLVRDGSPVDLREHLRRVIASVGELYGVAVDAGELEARVLAGSRGLPTARLRTSYDPGDGEWRVEATPTEVPGLDPRTLLPRHLPGGFGAHKWTDRRPVDDPSPGDDVLLVDDGDVVLECGRANVFAVWDEQVVTPPLDGRILPGTVRAAVLARLPVVERSFTLAELAGAAEVFATSSIRGVQPVAAVLGVREWEPGPVTSRLRTSLRSRSTLK